MNMNYSSAIKCVNAKVKLGGIQVGSGKQVNYSGFIYRGCFWAPSIWKLNALGNSFPHNCKMIKLYHLTQESTKCWLAC